MSAQQDKRAAALFMGLGAPLAHTLWMFSPPPNMTDAEMRRRSKWMLLISLVLLLVAFQVMLFLMRNRAPGASKELVATVAIFICGVPYLLIPASIFRLIFGVPTRGSGRFVRFLRGCAALLTFFITFIGSLVVLGFVTR